MAKADPKEFQGPIAARYGDRLRHAAMQAAMPASTAALEPRAEEPVLRRESVAESVRTSQQTENTVEPAVPEPCTHQKPATSDNTCIRVLVTPAERDELDKLLNNLSKAVGARVKLANILRASISQLLRAEEHIVGRGQRARHGFGARPANSDTFALARFEDQLREVVEAGLVDSARKCRQPG